MNQLELFESEYLDHLVENEEPEYRVCFILEEIPPEIWRPANRLIITPYLEKIATPDRRLEPYQERLRPSDTSPETDRILDLLFTLEQTEPLADSFIEHLTSSRTLPLFLRDSWGIVPIKIQKITRLALKYRFKDFRNGHRLYMPSMTIYSGQKKTTVTLPAVWYQSSSVFYYPDRMKGNLFVLFSSPDLLELLSDLFHNAGSMTAEEIEAQKQRLQGRQIGKLSIDPIEEEIGEEFSEPKPHLEFHGTNSGSRVRLYFEYPGFRISLPGGRSSHVRKDASGEITVYHRNRKTEQSLTTACSGILNPEKGAPSLTFLLRESRRDFLLTHGIELLKKNYLLTDKASGKGFRRGTLSIKHSLEEDHIDFQPFLETGEDSTKAPVSRESDEGILEETDHFYLLGTEDIQRLTYLKTMGLKEQGTTVSRFNLAAIDALYDRLEEPEDGDIARLKQLSTAIRDFEGIAEKPPTEAFLGSLRNYQKAGLNWIYFLFSYGINGCLADDMGLGKTVQSLAFLSVLLKELPGKSHLIVLPVSTSYNWEEEAQRFLPSCKVLRHRGSSRIREVGELEQYDLILVSYPTLRNDIELFESCNFGAVILDESQNIKNPDSRTFKAVRRLRSVFRLTLTGTPIENNTLELWSQMEFLNPGLLGNRREFQEQFARPIESGEDENAAELLRKIIFPFILRRKKENVLPDLPEKEEIILYSEMGRSQQEEYNTLKERFSRKIAASMADGSVGGSSMIIFDALLRLRQMALYPGLVDPDLEDIESSKAMQLWDTLPEILDEGHKVVLFSQFVQVLSRIKGDLVERGIDFCYIDGQTRDRASEVHQFQNTPQKQVFLISLRAGGVGINLTAADYVFLFDPWWNPAVEAQAIDRCHRYGQKNRVFAYRMIVKDTVEEKILQLQQEKRALMNQIVSEEKSFFKSLSKDDILQLFQ